jgi:hypothetical protein
MFIRATTGPTGRRSGIVSRCRRLILVATLAVPALGVPQATASNPAAQPTVVVVVGAPGDEEYGAAFVRWTGQWTNLIRKAEAKEIVIGLEANSGVLDREQLEKTLAAEGKEGPAELWLVLIGHGTFDGKEAKFNLRGKDVTAVELASWLQPFRRPVAVINTTSASAPFLQKISGANRVVITATRSGSEVNYARFGQYFAEAIGDAGADLDKDGQTSLLESYLMAARKVKEFYDMEGRLVTEHALLDDNGDGFGTPPDWFRGVRAVKSARDGAALDGFRAHQFHLVRSQAETKLSPEVRARRDALELSIAKLRDAKKTLSEEEYYQKLEGLLLDLARLYDSATN